jgi:hypothetical protein
VRLFVAHVIALVELIFDATRVVNVSFRPFDDGNCREILELHEEEALLSFTERRTPGDSNVIKCFSSSASFFLIKFSHKAASDPFFVSLPRGIMANFAF